MRIAIVHELWGAGAARCARDLERFLAARHEVRFYPRDERDDAASVLSALDEFQPDVVHCHSFYGDLPYSFLPAVSHRHPTCFTVHDPRPIGTIQTSCWDCDRNRTCLRCPLARRMGWRGRLPHRYFRERLAKRRAHRACRDDMVVIAPSRWIQKRLQAQELARFRFEHIPYGLDFNQYHPIPDARLHLGIQADMPVLLHVAFVGKQLKMNDRKGLRYLAEAFVDRVVKAHPSAILMIVGEGVVPNHPNVRPMGSLSPEQMPALYAAADVFVCPTLADNLPYTVLEAMACGTAVVGSAVGGVPEEVVEGVTGKLVPPGDSSALGDALVTLLNDRAKLSAMGEAGRQRAESVFSMDRFIARHEALYAEMASQATQVVPMSPALS